VTHCCEWGSPANYGNVVLFSNGWFNTCVTFTIYKQANNSDIWN
jgi:hypothetical protein